MRNIYLQEDIPEIIRGIREEDKREAVLWADELASGYITHRAHYEMERCMRPAKASDTMWNRLPEGFSDPEWIYALARHSHLLALSKAYAYTGNAEYAECYSRMLFSFIDNADLKGESWRSLEAGIRPENWIRSIEILEGSGYRAEKERKAINENLRAHIELLMNTRRGFQRLSNWGVIQDHGLFVAGLYLDEMEAVRTAIERLDEEAALQSECCGTHWEQSPLYQCEVLHSFLDTVLLAKRNRIELPESLLQKTELMAESLRALTSVSGSIFMTGDSDEISPEDLLYLASYLFKRPDLAKEREEENCWDSVYTETGYRRRSADLGADGHAVLRGEGTEIHLFSGNIGSGHGNISPLHADIAGKEKPFFIDSGRYTYLEGEKRTYYRRAEAHNIPKLAGPYPDTPKKAWGFSSLSETSRPRFREYKDVRAAEAMSLAYLDKGIVLRRRCLSLGDDIILIIDECLSRSSNRIEALFHAHPSVKASNSGRLFQNGNEFLHFYTNGEISTEKCTVSLHYNEESGSECIKTERTVPENGSLISLFTREDAKVRMLEPKLKDSGRVLTESEAIAMEIETSGVKWTLLSRPCEIVSAVDVIKAGSFEGYGRLAVKRSDWKYPAVIFS